MAVPQCRVTLAIKKRLVDVVGPPTATFRQCVAHESIQTVLKETLLWRASDASYILTRSKGGLSPEQKIEVGIEIPIYLYAGDTIAIGVKDAKEGATTAPGGPAIAAAATELTPDELDAALAARELRDRQLRIGPAADEKEDDDDILYDCDRISFLRACFNGETDTVRQMIENSSRSGRIPDSWLITGFRGACIGAFSKTAEHILTYFRPRPEVGIRADTPISEITFKSLGGSEAGDGTVSDLLLFVVLSSDDEFIVKYLTKHREVFNRPIPFAFNGIDATLNSNEPIVNIVNLAIAALAIRRTLRPGKLTSQLHELLGKHTAQLLGFIGHHNKFGLGTDNVKRYWQLKSQPSQLSDYFAKMSPYCYTKPRVIHSLLAGEKTGAATGAFEYICQESLNPEYLSSYRLLLAHELGLT